jgi:hypothetical protein
MQKLTIWNDFIKDNSINKALNLRYFKLQLILLFLLHLKIN